MEETIEGSVVENIAGEQECQIVVTTEGGLGFIGHGTVQMIEPGKRVRRGPEDGDEKYRQVSPLMRDAAAVLIKVGWRGEQLRELLGINRTAAYELAKQAREEHSKAVVAEALERARLKKAQEAVVVRDSWERSPEDADEERKMYSFWQGVRRFRS